MMIMKTMMKLALNPSSTTPPPLIHFIVYIKSIIDLSLYSEGRGPSSQPFPPNLTTNDKHNIKKYEYNTTRNLASFI